MGYILRLQVESAYRYNYGFTSKNLIHFHTDSLLS